MGDFGGHFDMLGLLFGKGYDLLPKWPMEIESPLDSTVFVIYF